MSREDDIRSTVQPWIDRLYELYELTDPRRGEETEVEKLRQAQVAMNICWTVFGRLLLWAQSQIVGYEVSRRHPDVAELLAQHRGKDLDQDLHELELLGMGWAYNWPSSIDQDEYNKFLDTFDRCETLLDDAALRNSIVRLLLSTDANTSFWRFPLSRALRALNAGEVDHLFHPDSIGRRGKAYKLDEWRAIAICHVYFEVGCGQKKHVALDKVAKELNVSAETIRSWEKTLQHDDFFCANWKAAWVAGRYREAFASRTRSDLRSELGEDFPSGLGSDLDWADHFLSAKDSSYSLDCVRDKLLELQRSEAP